MQTLPELQELTLNDTNLGDAGFVELVKLPKIKSLFVDSTKVTKEVYQKAKKEHPNLFLYYYRFDQNEMRGMVSGPVKGGRVRGGDLAE